MYDLDFGRIERFMLGIGAVNWLSNKIKLKNEGCCNNGCNQRNNILICGRESSRNLTKRFLGSQWEWVYGFLHR